MSLDVPARTYRPALEILADVVARPAFPAAEVEKVRQDLLASIRTLPDRPFDNTNRAFYRALYEKSPYRYPVEGVEETVRSITEDQIREFHRRQVVGRNVILVVAGPVEPDAIVGWARERFGGLPAGVTAGIGGTRDAAPARANDTLLERDQEQTTYNTGWPAVAFTDPDYVPLRAAVGVLGDRAFFKYVYEKGVAYRSWFYLTRRLGQGSVQNEMGVSPEVYGATSAEVLGDLERFVREPIPADELQASKRKLISRYYLDVQTSLALARELAFWEISGLGLKGFESFPEQLQAVTPQHARRAAKTYLLPERFVRVGIGRAPSSAPAQGPRSSGAGG